MTTFAIMTPPDNPRMSEFLAALQRVFDGNFFQVGPGQYMASRQNVLSGQISEWMGLNGEVGQYVVIASAGWGGWYHNSLWEWMRLQERPS